MNRGNIRRRRGSPLQQHPPSTCLLRKVAERVPPPSVSFPFIRLSLLLGCGRHPAGMCRKTSDGHPCLLKQLPNRRRALLCLCHGRTSCRRCGASWHLYPGTPHANCEDIERDEMRNRATQTSRANRQLPRRQVRKRRCGAPYTRQHFEEAQLTWLYTEVAKVTRKRRYFRVHTTQSRAKNS